MTVNTTWVGPTGATLDLSNGTVVTETNWDALASDLYRLGGTDGNAKTGPYQIGSTQTYSNANNTAGLTINQGAADDQALSLKSSDVAHGVTNAAETDTYGYGQKADAAAGGLNFAGITEGSEGLRLSSIITTDTTTTSTAAVAALELDALLKNGTSTTTNGATANLLVVRTNSLARFIVKGDGDVHNNGGSTAMATYDDDDDGALVEAVGTLMNPARQKDYRFSLVRDLAAHREALERGGVITTDPATGEFFLSYKGMLGLLIDAIRQVTHAHRTLEARVAPLLPLAAE